MDRETAQTNSDSFKELVEMAEFFKTAPKGVEVRIEISPEAQRQLDEELESVRIAQAVAVGSLQNVVVG